MSFLNLEVLKEKPIKVQKKNAPSKNFKKKVFGTIFLKKNKNYNSYGLMKIWSNFNPFKVLNY